MKEYRFRSKIIHLNIAIIVGLIMILSGVAYAYLVTVGNTNFDRQLEAEAIGIGSQISSSLKIADETALQLAANDYIIRVFQGIQPGKATENFFSSNPGLDGEVKKFLLSYTIFLTLSNRKKQYRAIGYFYN